jgi:hypothetical protein
VIRHLSYVSCDRCGGYPAQPGGNHREARAIARAEGYTHHPVDGDVCGRCNGTVDEHGWPVKK